MNQSLAPIILFAYNRPWHTEQVLSALFRNNLAQESILHIFLDGPKKNASDATLKKIEEVNQVVKKKKWCKEVYYHVAKENIGCRNSIIAGISEIINENGKIIVLEDDIVTSPWFLSFMNDTLNYYENRKSVFSISGWNLPKNKMQIPNDYPYDVYVSPRLLNWGWATWKDRWDQVNWNMDFVPDFIKNKNEIEAFNRGGDDLTPMLLDMYHQKIDAWDIQFAFSHFANHAVAIVPCISYTNNIGLDGSGIHCVTDNGTGNSLELSLSKYRLLDNIYEDKRIINVFYSHFYSKKRPIWKKIINRLSRILGGKMIFVIKKKVFS